MRSIEVDTGTQQYLKGQEVLDRKWACSLVDAWTTLHIQPRASGCSADSTSGGP